ncbi:hypothetical protein MTP99_013258 [Tenebrio molitor]|nr:hypothetical protein MTP99_013258 [Tenebrio molitor]
MRVSRGGVAIYWRRNYAVVKEKSTPMAIGKSDDPGGEQRILNLARRDADFFGKFGLTFIVELTCRTCPNE